VSKETYYTLRVCIVRCLLYLLFVIADINECVIQRLDFRAAACACVGMRVQALLNGSARV
jgi:hypothetical protein